MRDDRPLHLRFWFLVPEYQLRAMDAGELLELFERLGVTMHPSPDPSLEGHALLSMRLRQPDREEWRRHRLRVMGVTIGLDDIPPYEALTQAVAGHRIVERRSDVRVGGATQGEAMSLCHRQELWGYFLALAEFHRKHTRHNLLLWSVWHRMDAPYPQGVITRRAGEHSQARFTWAGDSGAWPYRDLIFVRQASEGILIERP